MTFSDADSLAAEYGTEIEISEEETPFYKSDFSKIQWLKNHKRKEVKK